MVVQGACKKCLLKNFFSKYQYKKITLKLYVFSIEAPIKKIVFSLKNPGIAWPSVF